MGEKTSCWKSICGCPATFSTSGRFTFVSRATYLAHPLLPFASLTSLTSSPLLILTLSPPPLDFVVVVTSRPASRCRPSLSAGRTLVRSGLHTSVPSYLISPEFWLASNKRTSGSEAPSRGSAPSAPAACAGAGSSSWTFGAAAAACDDDADDDDDDDADDSSPSIPRLSRPPSTCCC
jgi:hypothetical protein